MYIDKVPNHDPPPAVLLRESYREGGKVRKQTIFNLSYWPEHVVEGLQRLLKGENLVSVEEVFAIQRSLPHGHVEANPGMIRKTGLDELIASKRCCRRDLVLTTIVERLMEACSQLVPFRQRARCTQLSTPDRNHSLPGQSLRTPRGVPSNEKLSLKITYSDPRT